MTLAYWCVLIAAVLPYLSTGIAKSSGYGPRANRSPREFLATREGFRKRAHFSQQNAFEAFAPFAAAVIIAHLNLAAQDSLNLAAGVFIAARVGHMITYILDAALLRSLFWIIGFGAVIWIFLLAAQTFAN